MTAMNADETKQAGMPQGAEEEQQQRQEQEQESDGAASAGGQCDPETRIVAPPPRQRTLTRTAELDADCEDIELDDADDAADSITLELALSPHSSSTPTPSPTTADEDFAQLDNSKPFKIKDITRNIRKAVVATTLSELRAKVSLKFERAQPAIHLDCDGTEVDDEEYFSTLEPNAELIAVFPGEQWRDPSDYNANLRRTSLDAQRLRKLVSKLQPNYMNDDDLDKLSNMDPNSLVDITGREPKDSEYSARSDAARLSTELSC
ncbi:uncharacterized protein LOC6546920 isoform X2 [Drosophila erecta]|uniref:CIDE-N domain-containing protein n=2 Tax=Drosophila erecta TaxID=7220 RepID=B3NS89_DROER|nr:uncharacterized protein LOC6546920 isoform X2 [Drosophila erecta]XP_026836169.1 uncharacterized protein LOC6546920 isoform X2 [Drosophila erecta]EDV56391.1 uncharacterized protein Dere_GG20243 [Drosophila erecta]